MAPKMAPKALDPSLSDTKHAALWPPGEARASAETSIADTLAETVVHRNQR